ncbi:prephenate dehydrogenase [Thermosyntropha lipolytica DSM 11003]|uniref:Prephenate dehydrogenase n=1 Tax=Thermosyntropha lipolytica DSM 11003 TaxID=1123382 RepID=A0A1M5Q9B1_9FIRM|nr:prephenate dehydrogenase [Thermosyntropha lipolytica]SHH10744.1 prephenate dehydrogenase [Thermosyntropha lipolytica DSM 11003]
MKKNLFIIGLGLIGGSLGLALRESPLVNKIWGFDVDQEAEKKALELGIIDEALPLREGASQAGVVFLCTPLRTFPAIIEEIGDVLRPETLITDVGSTKENVMHIFKKLPRGVWGIGGHPMAGSEIKGINGADRYLFENAVYVLTPPPDVPEEALGYLQELLVFTGARVKIMEASYHDRLVATISHVPHLAAAALVNLTEGKDDNLMMAAGGFRDTTRIASSSPELWQDILFSNREYVGEKLEAFIALLSRMRKALADDDREALYKELKQAKIIRDQIPHKRKGLLPEFSEIVCIVPDQPGIIGKIGEILGSADINIVDIEILRAREGDGGSIRIGVKDRETAEKAVERLKSFAIKAWVR